MNPIALIGAREPIQRLRSSAVPVGDDIGWVEDVVQEVFCASGAS